MNSVISRDCGSAMTVKLSPAGTHWRELARKSHSSEPAASQFSNGVFGHSSVRSPHPRQLERGKRRRPKAATSQRTKRISSRRIREARATRRQARSTKGRQPVTSLFTFSEGPPFRWQILGEVVVEDDRDESQDHQEAELKDPLLHPQREIAARRTFQAD